MKNFLNLLLNLLSALFWFLLMLSFSDIKMTVLTVIAALVHELGHIAVLCFLKKDFSLPRAVASGFRIKTRAQASYKEEIVIALGGPVINLLFAFVFARMSTTFAVINLATALSNLMPMKDFDGYKVTSNTLSLLFGFEVSERLMPHITVFVSSLFVFLSLFMIMFFDGGYWIFFIFFTVFLQQILFLQNNTNFED